MKEINITDYNSEQLQSRDGAEILHLGKSKMEAYVVTKDEKGIVRPYLINYNGLKEPNKKTYLDIVLKEPETLSQHELETLIFQLSYLLPEDFMSVFKKALELHASMDWEFDSFFKTAKSEVATEKVVEFVFAKFLKALIHNHIQRPTNTLNDFEAVEEEFGTKVAENYKDWQDDYVWKLNELETFIRNSEYKKYLKEN